MKHYVKSKIRVPLLSGMFASPRPPADWRASSLLYHRSVKSFTLTTWNSIKISSSIEPMLHVTVFFASLNLGWEIFWIIKWIDWPVSRDFSVPYPISRVWLLNCSNSNTNNMQLNLVKWDKEEKSKMTEAYVYS